MARKLLGSRAVIRMRYIKPYAWILKPEIAQFAIEMSALPLIYELAERSTMLQRNELASIGAEFRSNHGIPRQIVTHLLCIGCYLCLRAEPGKKWQGQQDLNPRPTVLETAALPAELYPYFVAVIRYQKIHQKDQSLSTSPQLFPWPEPETALDLERVKGIEPSSSAWKAVALPLSYTRKTKGLLSNGSADTRRRMVGEVGLEPTKAYASGFTVRPLCHSGHSPFGTATEC
jgi:hypothetical protein